MGNENVRQQGSGSREVRLPGFILHEEIALGDLIKRATSTVGIRPCGACAERAARLNRRIVFSRWNRS
jgi:hypothetical protein